MSLEVRDGKDLYSTDSSPLLLCSEGPRHSCLAMGVTLEKNIINTWSFFPWTQMQSSEAWTKSWRADSMLFWWAARSRVSLSWEPVKLRVHTCSDSKEGCSSKDALGKWSAYLYPYWLFPAQHPRASVYTFLISAQNESLRPDGCNHTGLRSYPALPLTAVWPWPVTLTSEGSIPLSIKEFLALAAH